MIGDTKDPFLAEEDLASGGTSSSRIPRPTCISSSGRQAGWASFIGAAARTFAMGTLSELPSTSDAESTALLAATPDLHTDSSVYCRRRDTNPKQSWTVAPLLITACLSLLVVLAVLVRFPPSETSAVGGFSGTLAAADLTGTGGISLEGMSGSGSTTGQREALLSSARSLCDAFASKAPLDDVLDNFSSELDDEVVCLEHGLGILAPFLGREFRGRDGARRYFETISELLTYDNMSFEGYAVDEEVGLVSVVGKGRFTWKSTGNTWDEVFTYRLKFDDKAKVTRYEVWADSGAAFLASRGEL